MRERHLMAKIIQQEAILIQKKVAAGPRVPNVYVSSSFA
jgi:hypothetical protein